MQFNREKHGRPPSLDCNFRIGGALICHDLYGNAKLPFIFLLNTASKDLLTINRKTADEAFANGMTGGER